MDSPIAADSLSPTPEPQSETVAPLAASSLEIAPLAVGGAVISVTVEPVNYLTGDPISQAAFGQDGDRVAYRVAYSCSVEACAQAQVSFSPSQADPYGLAALNPVAYGPKTLLAYETWTRPNGVPDIAPTGTDQTGKVFSLGDLAAGASGTFLVTYQIPATATYTTARPAQFYPDGFPIQMNATMTSTTATGPASADAAPLTWHNKVPEPGVTISVPAGAVQPGTNVSISNYMGSGSFPRRDPSAVTGTSEWVGAGSYTVTQVLPAEAEIVGAIPDGGTYNAATHTVTWTRSSVASPSFYAAGGWGSSARSGWMARDGYGPRTLSLRFPASNFPEADSNGCNFERTLPVSLDTSVTYLDSARTTKSATTTANITVSCFDPFGVAATTKDVAPNNGAFGGNRIVYVPEVGSAANQYTWDVNARNGGNRPGVAVVEDNALDLQNAPVYRIELSSPGTIEWVLNTGQSGTTTGTSQNAPPGTRFSSAKVTSGAIAAGRTRPTDTGFTNFRVRFLYTVASDAPIGEVRTNAATSTMTWPGEPSVPPVTTSATNSLKFTALPATPPQIIAAFPVAPAVEGGGTAVPGRNVVFSVGGTTRYIDVTSTFTPEYVFIAPVGWTIVPGTASVAGSTPPGVGFAYATRVVGGVERDVVVATWPAGTDFGDVTALPTMTVTAKPTSAVAAGTSSVAEGWIGDSARNWTNTQANYAVAKQNAGDIDGSGDTSAWFSSATQIAVVSSADSITVTKEICQPDAGAADGCDWISDPTRTVPVPLNSTSIQYRISLQNTGNTILSNVVAYDVLPYIGDTGLTTGTAGTPRGSTFDEILTSVSSVTANLSLVYSNSTNPARPEVNPSSGGVNDWSAGAAGKRAIRATVNGSLAPGAVASFAYAASVGSGASADSRACNSVAIATNRTLPSEPQAVCATTAEADLEAHGVDTIAAQLDRPTVFPFVFENLGGSQSAPATVSVDVPAGVTVTGFPSGWTCTATSALPIIGPATLDCAPPANLEKGAPVSFPLPTVVTAPDVAVTVHIVGEMYDTDTGNNEHTITGVTTDAAGDIDVQKSDGVTALIVGQETTYTITIGNPLAFESLADVTVTDTLPAGVEFVSASDGGVSVDGVVSWVIDSIAGGGSADPTVTVRVLDEAPNTITNTATAEAVDPSDASALLSGSGADADVVDRITLSKTGAVADANEPRPGDTVTYTFVATNAGGGALSLVDIADSMPGLSAVTVTTWPTLPGYLGAGQSVTATASYVLTQADVDAGRVTNTATVSARSAGGSTVDSDATNVLLLPGSAALTLTKDGSRVAGTPQADDLVTFEFTVVNSGNVTVREISITDALPGLSALTFGAWPGAEGELGSGEQVTATATYALTQVDIDRGSLVNTATVDGIGPNDTPVAADDEVTVPLPSGPALTLSKTGTATEPTEASAGDTLTYTFDVENTGNVTLTGIAITDPLAGLSDIVYGAWPGTVGVLEPGQSVVATATYVTTQSDVDTGWVDNTATVDGTAPNGQPIGAIDSTTVSIPADPSISLTKTASTGGANPGLGDIISYSFRVENTGTMTANSVAIADPLQGLSTVTYGAWPHGDGILSPGEAVEATAQYVITQADLDRGRIDNTATARGTSANGSPLHAVDSATVHLTAAPEIGLTKTGALDGSSVAGDTVTFGFLVENTGNVTLDDVILDDKLAGLGAITFGDWPNETSTLKPGEQVTASATYVLTQADLDAGIVENEATASGASVRGGLVIAVDHATVPLDAAPAIELKKTGVLAHEGSPVAGDEIRYSFEIENTGTVTVGSIGLLDDMVGLSAIEFAAWPQQAGSLAPGESVTATASYALTQADLDAGSVYNSATLTGLAVRGGSVTDTDDATEVLPAAPSITFVKSGAAANPDRPVAGQTVLFTFVIENTGNVTASNVSIADELEGLGEVSFAQWPGAEGILAPGQEIVATAAYPLTQSDIDAGFVENTATATAVPSRGDNLAVTADTTVPLPADPRLALVKHATLADENADGVANPGESITFSFVVTNSGNVTIHDAVVNDAMVTGIAIIGSLAPGETVTVEADAYTVLAADAVAGRIINVATVVGLTPGGVEVTSNESRATVKSGAVPTLTKAPESGLAGTGFAGERVVIIVTLLLVAGLVLLLLAAKRRRRGARED